MMRRISRAAHLLQNLASAALSINSQGLRFEYAQAGSRIVEHKGHNVNDDLQTGLSGQVSATIKKAEGLSQR